MTNKALSIFNQLRPLSVDLTICSIISNLCLMSLRSNYPPYNLVKTGDHKFNIEIVLLQVSIRKILRLLVRTVC